MNTITVEASSVYPVHIGTGLLEKFPELTPLGNYSRIFIVTDKNVALHWLKPLSTACEKVKPGRVFSITVEPGEEKKNLSTLGIVWSELVRSGADRHSLVINLGGGVIGDLGGFAASTYMRGIDFIQVPTTLLSQVDASVGGKTGIDHAEVKNLVGSFAQPKAVIIDTGTLSTLPKRELNSAFAEILKHGLIKDRAYFERASADKPECLSSSTLLDLVTDSVKIKAAIVKSDEKERADRKLLNLGHTFGHAIESISLRTPKSALLHGEAVGLGILVEAKISELLGFITASDLQIIREALQKVGLPISSPLAASTSELFALMQRDKKNNAGAIKWTLLKSIGVGCFDQVVEDSVVLSALQYVHTK